jgi:hypothetical protein
MITRPLTWLAVAGGMICASADYANATLITFDNVADGTVINSVYSTQGVSFINPLGNGDVYARAFSPNAASNPNVVSVIQTGFPSFDARSGAVRANFAVAQGRVSIEAAIVRVPEGLGTPRQLSKTGSLQYGWDIDPDCRLEL